MAYESVDAQLTLALRSPLEMTRINVMAQVKRERDLNGDVLRARVTPSPDVHLPYPPHNGESEAIEVVPALVHVQGAIVGATRHTLPDWPSVSSGQAARREVSFTQFVRANSRAQQMRVVVVDPNADRIDLLIISLRNVR